MLRFIDKRFSVLLKNIFGAAAARGANLLITLALVPLTVRALDSTDYAYFAMAISLSMLTAYADLGMGLALINVIARRGEGRANIRAQRAVSVVWFALLMIGAVGLIMTGGGAVWLNFIHPIAELEQYNAMLLAIACVFAGLPSGIAQRLLFAEQKNIEASAWSTAGKLLSLCTVFYFVKSGMVDLFLLVFAILGVPMLVNWLSIIAVFVINKSKLCPKKALFDFRVFKVYLGLGVSYLALNIVPYAETGVDVLLLNMFGYSGVVRSYDVYLKMFMYIVTLISIAIFPVWPAIACANKDCDAVWVLKMKRIMYCAVVFISFFASAVFVIFGDMIVLLWTKMEFVVDFELVFAFGVFSVLSCIGLAQSMFLNGLGFIKNQVVFYVKYVPVVLIMKILALNFAGIVPMVWVCNGLYLYRLCYFNRKGVAWV